MRRGLLLLVGVIVLAMAPAPACAQLGGFPGFSGLSGSGSSDAASLQVKPFFNLGYTFIGANLNIPTVTPVAYGNVSGVDFKLQDGGVWMGTLGLDVKLSSFYLGLKADANASKNVRVSTNAEWMTWANQPVSWNGSQLQWWDVDGVVGYEFSAGWSALLGLRYDKITLAMKDPVDALGLVVNVGGEQDRGDLLVKTWIPYIGLRFSQPYYRAQLLYSPFASPQVTMPISAILAPINDQVRWDFANTGSFLEGYMDYDIKRDDPFMVGLWLKGAWMSIAGDGNGSYGSNTNPANSQSESGKFSRYDLGFGLKAALAF